MFLEIDGKRLDNIELLIFDKDGTITDLYEYWSWIAAERARIICEKLSLDNSSIEEIAGVMGLDLKQKRFNPEGPIGVKKRADVMSAVVEYLKNEGYADAMDVCEQAFSETDARSDRELGALIKVLPGVREFFSRIQGKCKTAIATADNEERANKVLKYVNIPCIDLIVGSDKVSRAKPDPEIVQTIIKRLNVEPEKTAIIGDSKYDILCGRNAGILAGIAVSTGLTSRQELEKYTEYVVDSLGDIVVGA